MNIVPITCFLAIAILGYMAATVENPHKAEGRLYQCFIKGKTVYASNIRPIPRGDGWYLLNGKPAKVDACVCMGCLSI